MQALRIGAEYWPCSETICQFDLGRSSSSSLIASARWVSPSANSFVVGFSVVLATSRNLTLAEVAHCAALLMRGDTSGRRRQPPTASRYPERLPELPLPTANSETVASTRPRST